MVNEGHRRRADYQLDDVIESYVIVKERVAVLQLRETERQRERERERI